MKKALVTGGAGFIASHLEDILVEDGWEVISADVIDRTRAVNIGHLLKNGLFEYHAMDVTDTDELSKIMKGCDAIFHMAANSDIRNGGKDPETDYDRTFLTTKSVLDSMRNTDTKKLFFPSTSAVYGNMGSKNLDENTGNLMPISYYGAYKLASEALISAYSYMDSINALIFRFPNVVGPRLTHGVIFDFLNKLRTNPNELEILGDGHQKKQYVHVKDLVKGIVRFMDRDVHGTELYNISTDSFATVNEIADITCARLGLSNVRYLYTGGNCGWKGDVPSFSYDTSKAKAAGWTFEFDSIGAIKDALDSVNL